MTAHSSSQFVVRKPRADFPLFPDATGRWAHKVRGKLHYFGKTADDPKGENALNLWIEQKDDLLAGRRPRTKGEGVTVRDVCNRHLASKLADMKIGKIGKRTFVAYERTTDVMIETFGRNPLVSGLRPEDFERLHDKLAAKHGISTLGREVTVCRDVFKYAKE